MTQPLILTLQLDDEAQAFYDALRQRFYPSARNVIAAHLTLFHQLPDEERTREVLVTLARSTSVMKLSSPQLRSMGRGVAVWFQSSSLIEVHKRLARPFDGSLIPQDRQRFQPHIVIQNKVSADAAQQTLQLLHEQELKTPVGVGLSVWRYLGGPWQHLYDLPFEEISIDASDA